MDSSVVIAILSVVGGIVATVTGIAVTKILSTNAEEMKRLEGVEDRFYTLLDYAHELREDNDDKRARLVQAGLEYGRPAIPWPEQMRTRP